MFIAIAIVTITHISSGGGGECNVGAPAVSLTPQLRALGGFDQAYDPDNRLVIVTVAVQAASAVSPSLIGASPGDPVRVASVSPQKADAIVVPLMSSGQGGTLHLAGLVAFLRDCAGRAYYSEVRDLSAQGAAAPSTFPAVSEVAASEKLGVATPKLVYTSSPFAPSWRNPFSGNTIPAS